ncbi:response regulator, partial [Enterobacter hormaechei]|uniref:response regulator n=1 Tax=Enterobacter hormaechei TaxID=158836 RepID=UPI0034A0C997
MSCHRISRQYGSRLYLAQEEFFLNFYWQGNQTMSRILIVDDHPVIRMAMKMLLEAEGHQIVGDTDNGVDAISLGRELKPD